MSGSSTLDNNINDLNQALSHLRKDKRKIHEVIKKVKETIKEKENVYLRKWRLLC